MSENKQAKISKNIQFAVLQIAHTYKSMFTYPLRCAEDLIIAALSPLIREREERLELEAKMQRIEALPEWARVAYQRDWKFETQEQRISRLRSEAGRRGGQVSKKA